MAAYDEKLLLVEGPGDRHLVCQLFEAYGTWGDNKSEWPFNIQPCKSNTDLLDTALPFHLNAKSAKIIGVVLDADLDPSACWGAFRNKTLRDFPNLPESCPQGGLIHTESQNNRRLGFWMMPDNSQQGMLETFLQYLVPADSESQAIWAHSVSATRDAQDKHKAPFKAVHFDKACMHTWLAWQNPPGQNFGDAISDRCLRPDVPLAHQFVRWLWNLYELPDQPVLKVKMPSG